MQQFHTLEKFGGNSPPRPTFWILDKEIHKVLIGIVVAQGRKKPEKTPGF